MLPPVVNLSSKVTHLKPGDDVKVLLHVSAQHLIDAHISVSPHVGGVCHELNLQRMIGVKTPPNEPTGQKKKQKLEA